MISPETRLPVCIELLTHARTRFVICSRKLPLTDAAEVFDLRQAIEREDDDENRKAEEQRELQPELAAVAEENLPAPREQHAELRQRCPACPENPMADRFFFSTRAAVVVLDSADSRSSARPSSSPSVAFSMRALSLASRSASSRAGLIRAFPERDFPRRVPVASSLLSA